MSNEEENSDIGEFKLLSCDDPISRSSRCPINPVYAKFVYDVILEPALIMVLIRSYSPVEVFLPLQLFSQDSLSNAIRYLSEHLGFYTPFRDPNVGNLPKYSFYVVISALYYLLHILVWFNVPYPYVFYGLSYLSNPGIVELILNQVPYMLDALESYRKRTLNYLGCLVLSKIVNFICIKNLNQDPQISGEELSEHLTAQNKVYFWSFIKIFLLNSLIKYLERNAYYYSRLIKTLYNWGTLIEVPKHHKSMILDSQTLHPRDTLASIIKRRKWYYFYDPTVLNLMIRIYNEKNGNFLEEFFYHFKVSLFQFFTMWTLSTFIPIPILCVLFRVPEFYQSMRKGTYLTFNTILMPVMTGLLWYNNPRSVIQLSFFSEFLKYVNNPATRHILRVVYQDYLPQLWCMMSHHNKYNFYLVASLPIVFFLGQQEWKYLIILPMIARYNFIYIWLGVLGMFSGFNPFHLFILNLLMYVMINLHGYQNYTPPKPELNIDIIQSYWGGHQPQHPENKGRGTQSESCLSITRLDQTIGKRGVHSDVF